MALVAVMGLLGMLVLSQLSRSARVKGSAQRIKCVNNLKNVGLAFRIFATDNNDLFPPALMISNGVDVMKIDPINVFRALSNELSTPIILYCPSDAKGKRAEAPINFDTMTAMNISYFASLSANQTNAAWHLGILAGDCNLMTNGAAVGSGVTAMLTNEAGAWSWSKEMHVEQGNIAMADGSVQQMGNVGTRFAKMIAEQDMATNWLAFP
jgi:prepilin-type processing-associated H-X9-DG protein